MTVADLSKLKPRFELWAKLLSAAVAVGLLAGCVVVPAYGPGPYNRGYYAPSGGYYYPYYRDRDDYYRRW